jgi:hypothetical protein
MSTHPPFHPGDDAAWIALHRWSLLPQAESRSSRDADRLAWSLADTLSAALPDRANHAIYTHRYVVSPSLKICRRDGSMASRVRTRQRFRAA